MLTLNTQIFHLIKYDLNGHSRSQNVTFMFIITLTYVLMDNYRHKNAEKEIVLTNKMQSKKIFFKNNKRNKEICKVRRSKVCE